MREQREEELMDLVTLKRLALLASAGLVAPSPNAPALLYNPAALE